MLHNVSKAVEQALSPSIILLWIENFVYLNSLKKKKKSLFLLNKPPSADAKPDIISKQYKPLCSCIYTLGFPSNSDVIPVTRGAWMGQGGRSKQTVIDSGVAQCVIFLFSSFFCSCIYYYYLLCSSFIFWGGGFLKEPLDLSFQTVCVSILQMYYFIW